MKIAIDYSVISEGCSNIAFKCWTSLYRVVVVSDKGEIFMIHLQCLASISKCYPIRHPLLSLYIKFPNPLIE